MKHFLAATALSITFSAPALADDDHPVDFDDVEVQAATAEDMAMLEPFIGTFRGQTYTADSGTEYYFTITYEYYNRLNTVVKFTLTTHLPETGEARPLGEGYYYFDREAGVIRVMGVFKDGRLGSGYMTPFDPEAGYREVRIEGQAPTGQVTQVRDTFRLIDENSWLNITYIATEDGTWQKVSEDTYTRVEESQG